MSYESPERLPKRNEKISGGNAAMETLSRQAARLLAAGVATWLTGKAAELLGEGSPVFSSDAVEVMLFSAFMLVAAPLHRYFFPTKTDSPVVSRQDVTAGGRKV